MENDNLEKIVDFVKKNYDGFEPDIGTAEKYGFDDATGLTTFNKKRKTDYYCLNISKEKGKNVVKVSNYHKFIYKISGKKRKQNLLIQYHLTYLKDKEKELPLIVASERIIDIDSRTKTILNSLNEVKVKLDESYEKPQDNNNIETSRILISLDDECLTLDSFNEEFIYNLQSQFSDTVSSYLPNLNTIILESEVNNIRKIKENIRDGKFKFKDLNALNFNPIAIIEEEIIRQIPERDLNEVYSEDEMLWNLKMIGTDVAHEINKGRGVRIGIIDTGVDYNHPEISSRFKKENLGYDFVFNRKNPMDENGHGTHVAGTVAGKEVGVAPESRLYSLRVLDRNGRGTTYNVIRAVEWSIVNELNVINLSLGGGPKSRIEELAFNKARESGVLAVAAGGNTGKEEYHYPASYNCIIGVAAVDKEKQRAYFSTMNDKIDISAPGQGIYSCYPNNSYRKLNGTSMATPHITGVCALGISESKKDPDEIDKMMKDTAEKLGEKIEYGAGLVRADKLMEVI